MYNYLSDADREEQVYSRSRSWANPQAAQNSGQEATTQTLALLFFLRKLRLKILNSFCWLCSRSLRTEPLYPSCARREERVCARVCVCVCVCVVCCVC